MYRSFQWASWLALLLWLFVVADDSAVACSRADVGYPGCAGYFNMLCLLCMSRSAGPREYPGCNQINDGGCSRFRAKFQLATVRDYRDLYHSADLHRTQPGLLTRRDLEDDPRPQGGIIGIVTTAYYLVKKKNQLNHISSQCDLSELQGAVPDSNNNIMSEYFNVCGENCMAKQLNLYCGGWHRRE